MADQRGFFGFARQALANPAPSPLNALADAVGRMAGPAIPAAADAASNAYRDNVPANYRILISSLLGNRAPITNKDFAPAELGALARLVAGDQAKLPQRVAENQQAAQAQRQILANRAARLAAFDAAKPTTAEGVFNTLGIMGSGITPQNARALYVDDPSDPYGPQNVAAKADARAARAQQGIGAIQYYADPAVSSGYPSTRALDHSFGADRAVHLGPLSAGLDYGDRNVNAIANTLGDFVYKPAPGGGVTIDDNYSWRNTLQDSKGRPLPPPTLPQALAHLLTTGDIEGVTAALMPDAATGRQTHISLLPQALAASQPSATGSQPTLPSRFGFGSRP